MNMRKLAFLLMFFAIAVFAQQPQAPNGTPIAKLNAAYTNGIAPGYWPTKGTGLTLNVSAGTVVCSGTTPTYYAAGTLTMTNSTTNYVYLNTASSCAVTSNTTGFTTATIPIAVVVAAGGVITTITDVRSPFNAGSGGGGSSAGWYVASQSIQWVSALGLDTNDGLSPATAKLTWDRACTALTGGSNSPPLTCGQGTIYVIGSVAANTDATKGRWLMGLTDVNYASPPTGWYRSSGALRTICVGGNNSVYANGSVATCTVSGGSSTPGIPGLWLSNLFNFEDDHIAVQQYLGSPVRIGID